MHGFTLIEVTVTLLISAFLLSGIVGMMMGSKQSYLFKENIGQIQENLQSSSAILTRTISMAETVHQDSNAEQVIISYSGGEGVNDCLGKGVVSGLVVNHFYVKKNTLYCRAAYPAMVGPEQLLINDVARITVQYGVDEGRHGQADRYTSEPDDWSAVINVRIILQLLNSSGSLLPPVTLTVAMRPRIFSRLNGTVGRDDTRLDRRLENAPQLSSQPKRKWVGHQLIDVADHYRAWNKRNNRLQFAGTKGEISEAIHCGFTGGGIRSGDGDPLDTGAPRCLG